jgi:hypothetical protein
MDPGHFVFQELGSILRAATAQQQKFVYYTFKGKSCEAIGSCHRFG